MKIALGHPTQKEEFSKNGHCPIKWTHQSESKIFFFFSALPINIIAIPKKQNSFWFANQHHRSNLLLANHCPIKWTHQSESKIFFFFSALQINIIAIPKKQNSFSLFFSSYSSSFASSPSSKRRGRSVHGHSKNSKIPKIWPNSQMGISGVPTCRQGAVPAPVGFDFTPRCSVDEKKKPGVRQKERVRRLLFDKAN